MPWLVLVVSAVFEAVWATALGVSDGLTRPGPTVVFTLALTASTTGLGWASARIPIGTAYAVWVGLGTVLTVGCTMSTGAEPVSVGKVVCITVVVAAVVGLKLAPARPRDAGHGPSHDLQRGGAREDGSL